ncbi:hypothetical protein PM082_004549 [Marasmius tenuissimus]|nr:hypothetical protein PM082_004549 [Marasmius tenuissimus]
MHQIFAKTSHTGFTNTIFCLPTLGSFTEQKPEPHNARVSQPEREETVDSGPIQFDCVSNFEPTLQLESAEFVEDEKDDRVPQLLATRQTPLNGTSPFRTRHVRQSIQTEETNPFEHPRRRKVMNKPFWMKWYTLATRGTIDTPPQRDATVNLEDYELFLHINLDAIDHSKEPDFGAFITVWM